MFVSSSLLLPAAGDQETSFVKIVGKHLVDKLTSQEEKNSEGAQLLRGLSVLCECQGAPIVSNQSELVSMW